MESYVGLCVEQEAEVPPSGQGALTSVLIGAEWAVPREAARQAGSWCRWTRCADDSTALPPSPSREKTGR